MELIRTASWTVVCPSIAGGDESLEAVLAVLVDVYAIPMFPDRGIVLQVYMSHWLRWLNSVRIHVVVVESLVRGTITRCRPDKLFIDHTQSNIPNIRTSRPSIRLPAYECQTSSRWVG